MFIARVLIFALGCLPVAAGGHEIRGVVTDVTGAALGPASIRVVGLESGLVAARATSDRDGAFRIGGMDSGSFTVVVWVQGFRARRVNTVVLPAVTATELGRIQLAFAGCDAPGVMCDFIGADEPDAIVRQSDVDLRMNCGLAMAAGKVYCPADAKSLTAADIRLIKESGSVYLAAVDGATLSVPNLPRGDCREAEIRLWHVTRKRHQSSRSGERGSKVLPVESTQVQASGGLVPARKVSLKRDRS